MMSHPTLKYFLLTLIVMANCGVSRGQGIDATPLYEREAFDRITLDKINKNAVVDVFPIESLKRGLPPKFAGNKFVIRRLEDPINIQYQINGKHIVSIRRFKDMLLAEAKKALAARDVDEAFRLMSRLQEEAPNTPGIKSLQEEFFFADTRELFRRKRYDESLLSIERVLQLNPNRDGLPRALNGILSQMIGAEFATGNYRSVRAKVDFAARKYGTITRPLVEKWSKSLEAKGQEQFTLAKTAYAKGDTSDALAAIRKAAEIWPSLDGVEQLKNSILAQFPNVRVGVTQKYERPRKLHSSSAMLNWATRRTDPLLQRELRLLEDYTVDGAIYGSEFGQLKASSDLQKIELKIDADVEGQGHRLTQQMLALANPNRAEFSPRWAEYVQDITLTDSTKIEVQLTRPTLRPEALLPTAIRDSTVADLMKGSYELAPDTDGDSLAFVRVAAGNKSSVNELSETLFEDMTEATDALESGLVDIVDRINPGDFDRLLRVPEINLIPYRLPTIHGLVFNDREALLRDSSFRRGLLYGIDRQTFVTQEIGSNEKEIATVLSGFAPIGRSKNDPLGYAYNRRVEPRPYDPSLGMVLLKLALRSKAIKDAAKKKPDEPNTEAQESAAEGESVNAETDEEIESATKVAQQDPELPELVLAFPDSRIAEIACVSIAANWQRIGVKVKLRPLAAGQATPVDNEWDVLYVETTVEEPLVDLPELVLGHKILGRHGGLVWQAMRQLQDTTSLEDSRNEFERIHRLVYDHTPILPLWQIIEHIAVRKNISGISDAPFSLYHDIDQWRLSR